MLALVILGIECLVNYIKMWHGVEPLPNYLPSSCPMQHVVKFFCFIREAAVINKDIFLLATLFPFWGYYNQFTVGCFYAVALCGGLIVASNMKVGLFLS